jgi:hypothetical protein
MNKILEKIISRLPIQWIVMGLISLVSGLIFGLEIGVYTFMGIFGLIIVFVWLRQLYWFITSTGDYNNKK